jgi:hypothetical protein
VRVLVRLSALLLAITALAIASSGIALGQGATKITFQRWVVVLGHQDEKNAKIGQTFEHCASEPVTTIAAYGRVKNTKEGVSTVERWFRNGKLYHAFHLVWSSTGGGGYSTYGLGTDNEAGFRDGNWKVEKRQHGHLIGTAAIKLVSDTAC